MNGDFILAQLRVAAVAIIAYCGGRGWFTPADATLATALLSSLGPVVGPWTLSILATWGTKKVPQESVAVIPKQENRDVNFRTDNNGTSQVVGKIVGGFLVAAILFLPQFADAAQWHPKPPPPKARAAFAQGPILQKAIDDVKAKIIADLTAARDDAKINQDPSELCWQVLLNHANTMPPKIVGVAHGVQRLRTMRRNLPAISDACAVVKDGARQAVLQIFGAAIGGAATLATFGL